MPFHPLPKNHKTSLSHPPSRPAARRRFHPIFRPASIVVEVLVTMIILFLTVAISVTAWKHLETVHRHETHYERLYRAVLNLRDYLDADICQKEMIMKGRMNDYEYRAECRMKVQRRNYVKAFMPGEPEGHFGPTLVTLYQVRLYLQKDGIKKHFTWLKTVTKRAF